jgi:UDP-N-acetylmuramoylalanine--D-glutamate ligase
MNTRLESFKQLIKGRKIAVLGVGISNRPLIRFLHRFEAVITAFDMLDSNDPVLLRSKNDFENEGIMLDWSTGPEYLSKLTGFDIIFRTPKMRFDLPELVAERARGAVITSEMEVFMDLCPAKIWAVTGSDGKTTTTTLISLILKESGYKVHLGGNIGTPLLDRIEQINPEDAVVLELSSFQLISMRKSPDIAVITNITPNHLDVHLDFEEYISAKKNIFLYQSFNDRLVLNIDNEITGSFNLEARGFVSWFSRLDKSIIPAAVLSDGWLCWQDQKGVIPVVKAEDIVIPGKHNIENYLAAISAVWGYAGAEAIRAVATAFGGVEHRLELVRELDGIRYYNSSIDTSPTRSIAALSALSDRGERAVLIMGGQDKKCDYSGLGLAIIKVSRKIILCGDNSDLIEKSIRSEAVPAGVNPDELTIIRCSTYEESVQKAREISTPGEVVVLTPAGTSFDKFRHFEERGNLYKRLVNQL